MPGTVPKPKTVGKSVDELKELGVQPTEETQAASDAERQTPWWLMLPRYPFLGLIKLYQKTLSLDHGPLSMFVPYGFCRYQPTCSQYGYDAIKNRGVMIGIPLTVWRILRCNPMSDGGFDEVPEKGFRKAKNK